MSIEIRLENITKTFKAKNETIYALKNINLNIPAGKTISILGPSGCGKTTLLKVIAGLEKPDEGKIFFNSEDVSELSPYERRIGMVFQNYALYPHYKARGNLAFPFWIKKVPEKEIDEKIRETAKILGVGFEYLLDKKPKELSGGEQQRVAIGRCIIRNPSVMLFDEPLSNLDAKLRVITRAQLKKLLVTFNVTSVYVTHDQTEAISIGDLIGIMNNGEIIQVGTYEEIVNNPKNSFVASFFGKPSMNLIEVKVLNSQVIWRDKTILLDKKVEDGEYLLGFHGKDVEINPNGEIKGEIYFIDGTPADILKVLHVQLEDNSSIKIEIKSGEIYRCGEKIAFSLPKKIYLFKKSSGERII
ncbi:MAG: ABC transporter ATP-binding protein [Dictyoglomus thermophilum]